MDYEELEVGQEVYFCHILGKFATFSIDKCKVRTLSEDIKGRKYCVLNRENGLTWMLSPEDCRTFLAEDHKKATKQRALLKKQWLENHKGEKTYGDDAERDASDE